MGHAQILEDYLLKRSANFKLNQIPVDNQRDWARPLEVFEDAYRTELQYRDHLENLVELCRKHNDELSVLKILELLDMQIESCNEYELIVKKAKAYTALEGLYYHLDKELSKKAK